MPAPSSADRSGAGTWTGPVSSWTSATLVSSVKVGPLLERLRAVLLVPGHAVVPLADLRDVLGGRPHIRQKVVAALGRDVVQDATEALLVRRQLDEVDLDVAVRHVKSPQRSRLRSS